MTPFEEILGAHLSCGLVHSTPEVFLLAQECHWTGTEMISRRDAAVTDAEHRPGKQTQDLPMNAWFVELAAACRVESRESRVEGQNPIREFLRVAPRPHEYVLWYRAARNRPHNLHAYRWDHFAKRVKLES